MADEQREWHVEVEYPTEHYDQFDHHGATRPQSALPVGNGSIIDPSGNPLPIRNGRRKELISYPSLDEAQQFMRRSVNTLDASPADCQDGLYTIQIFEYDSKNEVRSKVDATQGTVGSNK